jgi:tetratricopeptide (TPR) repeat protein
MVRWSRICLVAALCSLTACNRRSPTGTGEPAASQSTTSVQKESASKTLALAAANGTTPVDTLIGSLQGSAKRNPGKIDWWILLGRAWVRKARESSDPGYYLNADACADIALEISPDDKLALDLRALVLLNDHKFEAARALAEKVATKSADDPGAWGNLSDALLELGRIDEAADAAQKMMDLKPNLPSYSRASYFQWLAGDTAHALEYARLAADSGQDPRDPEPRAWVIVQAAMIFWHQGDYDGADAGFERALDEMHEYPPALVGRGRVAMGKGDAKRAAELFARAYRESPLVETAWLLGDARELAGDANGADEARQHLEKDGHRTDPRTLSLYYSTKNVHPAEALALAEGERKVRGDIYTDDAVAWALYRNGRFAEARTSIEHARRLGTLDARLLFHQGAIAIASGDGGGKKVVLDALKLNPKFDVSGAAEAAKLAQDTK